jgi:beta-barrel assembly-enhancing protease
MARLLQRQRMKTFLLVSTLAGSVTLSPAAQTRITPHSNSFSPEDDVKLGREAAAEVRKQLPVLDDRPAEQFVERIGNRLVDAIPDELRQPAFRYSFDVVNVKEINAFALPGGPMFLHRGMIEAAKTDGEVAGVMAHELSHVVLRHGTAQATKGQKFQIGAIAGQVLGAIVGGRTGSVIAQGSQFGLGTYFLKYSREYEREADLMGAQIMARAGYDPREMANMFKTIERQGGSNGPEWLSDHPNPGNRYEAINREAQSLQVARATAPTSQIQEIHSRLARMPPAPTMQQIAQSQQGRDRGSRPVSTGRRERVDLPSDEWQTYRPAQFLRINVPANWRQFGQGNTVTYAPEGGYVESEGQSAFTHGIEIGVMRGDGSGLQQSTEQLLRSFARSNPQLRRQEGYSRTMIGGREGITTTLSNVSELTGEREAVNVSTAQLRDGSVLFLIGVAPENEASTYLNTFRRVRQSLQISDTANH